MRVAVRFEEKIYTGATNQFEYLKKIYTKMSTIEQKSHQNPMRYAVQSNSGNNGNNPPDPASQGMQCQVNNQGQPHSIPVPRNQSLALSHNAQNHVSENGNCATGYTNRLPNPNPNIVLQHPMPNVVSQNTLGNSMGQGGWLPSNTFAANSQRQNPGRQQQQRVPQQQHPQGSQQYLYQQQMMKQKLQQSVMQPSATKPSSNNQQPSAQQHTQAVLRKQRQPKQAAIIHQQSHMMGQHPNTMKMQQNQPIGPQICIPDMQQQQIGPQNNGLGNSNTQANQHSGQMLQQRDMQQRLQTSASMDSTAVGSSKVGDWQEEYYQKIQNMKDMYLPELNEKYQRVTGKLRQVKSMSAKALSASARDIGSVVSMMDRIPGSAPGNESRAADGQDWVSMTMCRLQARNFIAEDETTGTRKMKRYASAMPLNNVSSGGIINDSFNRLAGMETFDVESTATSPNKKPRLEANLALSEEIREINKRLIDTVVDIVDEDVDPTSTTAAATSQGGEGTIVKCSYTAVGLSPDFKSHYASAQMSPIEPLRLLVPSNYPNCSPTLLDKFPVEVSKEYEDFSMKAKLRFSTSLGCLSEPMSLGEIARTWDICARAVISEYAQQSDGGNFSSKYGTWENCLTT